MLFQQFVLNKILVIIDAQLLIDSLQKNKNAIIGGTICVGFGAAVTILISSWTPSSKTTVKVRGIVHFFNFIKSKVIKESADDCKKICNKLESLFEEVIIAERLAFNETFSCERSKRHLFQIQLEGIYGEGNRFSPLGRVLSFKDVEKNLLRRIKFAQLVAIKLPTENDRNSVNGDVIIIAGLPRTGSTMLHRLLSADDRTRTPLWWEQMHDVEPLPTPPSMLTSDPRALAVEKGLEGLKVLSPNMLAEADRFHKIGTYEVEECAPFIRRYFNDMDSPYLSTAAIAERPRWHNDPNMDKTFIIRHMKAWLALETLAFPVDESRPFQWVIKAPLFSVFLNELLISFPTSTYVFTNRNPLSVIPSTCGLVEVFASLKADWIESTDRKSILETLGDYVVDRMTVFADKQKVFVEEASKNGSTIKCLCLRYPDVIKDPIKEVQRYMTWLVVP